MLDSTRGAAMFLRRYSRTKDGKPHTYYALVESVRTDAGPRQQVVAYLGELNHDQERRWQRTVVFHNRQGETQQLRLFPDDDRVPLPDDPEVARIRLNSVGWSNGPSIGMRPPAWRTCWAFPTTPSPRTGCTARSTACVRRKRPSKTN